MTLLLHPSVSKRPFALCGCSYRGEVFFYPCSVIKVFYMVAAQAALEEGRIVQTAELDRATSDMITWSSNTATNYIIDIITGTTGDTDLPEDEMPRWVAARNKVNA